MSSGPDISGCPFSGANECGDRRTRRTRIHSNIHGSSPMNGLAILLQDLLVLSVHSGQVNSWRTARQRACSTRGNASYRFRLASFMHIHAGPAASPTRTTWPWGSFRVWSLRYPFLQTPMIPLLSMHRLLVTLFFLLASWLVFDALGKWSRGFLLYTHRELL